MCEGRGSNGAFTRSGEPLPVAVVRARAAFSACIPEEAGTYASGRKHAVQRHEKRHGISSMAFFLTQEKGFQRSGGRKIAPQNRRLACAGCITQHRNGRSFSALMRICAQVIPQGLRNGLPHPSCTAASLCTDASAPFRHHAPRFRSGGKLSPRPWPCFHSRCSDRPSSPCPSV